MPTGQVGGNKGGVEVNRYNSMNCLSAITRMRGLLKSLGVPLLGGSYIFVLSPTKAILIKKEWRGETELALICDKAKTSDFFFEMRIWAV